MRVEAYGAVDEVTSQLGFARSVCDEAEMANLARHVQVEWFTFGSALATAPGGRKAPAPVEETMVERLTAEVHRIEGLEGVVAEADEPVQPLLIAYLGRLSELLWLVARTLEVDAGVNGTLRGETGRPGNRWSPAW